MEALSSLKDYLVFRQRYNGFSELQQRCFAELASVRNFLSRAGSESAAMWMRAVIRREGLLAWKAELEHQLPQLHIGRTELEGKIGVLRSSLQKLTQTDQKLLTTNFIVNEIGTAARWEGITRLRGPREFPFESSFRVDQS